MVTDVFDGATVTLVFDGASATLVFDGASVTLVLVPASTTDVGDLAKVIGCGADWLPGQRRRARRFSITQPRRSRRARSG